MHVKYTVGKLFVTSYVKRSKSKDFYKARKFYEAL